MHLCLWNILESNQNNITDPINTYSSQPTNNLTIIPDPPICSDSDSTTEFNVNADMRYADSLGLLLTRRTAHAYEDNNNNIINNEETKHFQKFPSVAYPRWKLLI